MAKIFDLDSSENKICKKYRKDIFKKIAHLFSKSKFKIIFDEKDIPKYDFYKHLMSLPKIYYEKI